jgi:hypothetical protein
VIRRVAQAMANQVVSHDLIDQAQPSILLDLSLDSRPGDADFDTGIDQLFFRLMGQRAAPDRLAGLISLWEEVESLDGASAAWQGVLRVLFQDPDFVVY